MEMYDKTYLHVKYNKNEPPRYNVVYCIYLKEIVFMFDCDRSTLADILKFNKVLSRDEKNTMHCAAVKADYFPGPLYITNSSSSEQNLFLVLLV